MELRDLPGFTVNPLSQCPNLKYLVVKKCQLVAVDGIEAHPTLQYADLSVSTLTTSVIH